MEVWQQWCVSLVSLTAGLYAIYATYLAERRKMAEHTILLREKLQKIHKRSEGDAVKEAWDYAKRREAYYNADKETREQRLKDSEAMIESLRRELHTVRDEWMGDKTKLALSEDRLCRCEEAEKERNLYICKLEARVRKYRERLGLDSDGLGEQDDLDREEKEEREGRTE